MQPDSRSRGNRHTRCYNRTAYLVVAGIRPQEHANAKEQFVLLSTSLLLLVDREQLPIRVLDSLPSPILLAPRTPLGFDVLPPACGNVRMVAQQQPAGRRRFRLIVVRFLTEDPLGIDNFVVQLRLRRHVLQACRVKPVFALSRRPGYSRLGRLVNTQPVLFIGCLLSVPRGRVAFLLPRQLTEPEDGLVGGNIAHRFARSSARALR